MSSDCWLEVSESCKNDGNRICNLLNKQGKKDEIKSLCGILHIAHDDAKSKYSAIKDDAGMSKASKDMAFNEVRCLYQLTIAICRCGD